MTREVLEKKLKIAGIPDYIYNLTGQGKNDECLCLEKIQDKWSVYYLERGIKTCLLYTSPSPRDPKTSRMPSSA